MSEIVIKTIFQFKRGMSEAWARNNPVLEAGEPGFELDTGKFKIGKGSIPWNDLDYVADGKLYHGYFMNGKFYTDSTYQEELPLSKEAIYINENERGALYTYNGSEFEPSTKTADEVVAGIMKLYKGAGSNEDGTMTQKAITDGVNNIKFDAIDTDGDGELDCLVLDLPWD